MHVLVLTITLRLSWAKSLKDKRSVVKSLTAKLQRQFGVSVAEASHQDNRQTAVLAIAGLAATTAQADAMAESWLRFVAGATDAELISETRELR